MQFKEAVVVDAARSPFGRAGDRGVFRDITYHELLTPVLTTLIERNHINPEEIDDIIMGSVGLSGGLTNARSIVMEMGLPFSIPGLDLNRQCGSALVSCAIAANQIMVNCADIILAGGIETMDRRGPVKPSEVGKRGAGDPEAMLRAQAAAPKEEYPEGWKFAELMPEWYKVVEPWIYNMGLTAEKLSKVYGISRQDADEFSYYSHMKTIAAQQAGLFEKEIVPITIKYTDGTTVTVDKDQGPRPDTTIEKLAALKPAYTADGVVTAGNSCPRNDGATACLMMSKDKAREMGLKPLVTFRYYTQVGVDPTIMGLGPVPAIQKLLKRTGMSIKDFGLVEINEAFACVSLNAQRQLGFDMDILNVKGGAIAIGHPLGASGARIVGTLAREMVRRQVQWGLIGICCGGGQGVAAALELENYDW